MEIMNTAHRSSLQIALGLRKIPYLIAEKINPAAHVENNSSAMDERDKVNNRDPKFDEKRKTLVAHIDSIVKVGVININDVWANIEDIEEETGTEIFLRTKKGNLMSLETFRTYVLKSIKDNKLRPTNKRERIINLFLSGKTELQIRELVDCKHGHIHRCLVDAKLKAKKPTPNRVYNHNRKQK